MQRGALVRRALVVSLAALHLATSCPADTWPSWRYAASRAGCVAPRFSVLTLSKNAFGASLLMDTLAAPGTQATNSYGVVLTRVGGVSGAAFSAAGFGAQGTVPWNNAASGNWGRDSRHHYTKESPWNADGSLFLIQNPTSTNDTSGASVTNQGRTGSSTVILNTSTWQPTSYLQCVSGGDSIRDLRWDAINPNWMVVLKQTSSGASNDSAYGEGDYVGIVDVTTCKIVKRTPIKAEGGNRIIRANLLGAGEGQMSSDGTRLILCTLHRQNNFTRPDTIQVVNLTTMTLGTPWEVPACSLEVDASPSGGSANQKMDCNIGHVSIAASGNRGWVLYASDDAQDGAVTVDTTDAVRVFDISGTTITGFHPFIMDSTWRGPLNTGVRGMCATSLIGGANTVLNSYGWVSNLKHACAGIDPFTGHDMLFGAQRCGRSGNEGQLEGVDLQSGSMRRLTGNDGTFTESSIVHVTATGYLNPGYCVVSYDDANGTKPQAELVMVRTDGRGRVFRIAETRTRDTGCDGTCSNYRGEAHPALSWDGRFLAYATDWRYNCTNCGKGGAPKSYMADLRQFCLP